jgi:hypothetical protein
MINRQNGEVLAQVSKVVVDLCRRFPVYKRQEEVAI